jgi:putative membrane protein
VKFVIRTAITAIAVWIASLLVDGIQVTADSGWRQALTLIGVAVIIGLVNSLLKPIVKVIGCPLYVLTLGLFAFVVNALLFQLTSWIAGKLSLPFHVDGFWSAFWGAIIVSFVSWLLGLSIRDGYDTRPADVTPR